MRRSFISGLGVATFVLSLAGPVAAHVPFAPDRWLDNGGRASDMSPEFYWEIELKRMARDFTPPEKRVLPPVPREDAGSPQPPGGAAATPDANNATSPDDLARAAMDKVAADFTSRADAADFDDALQTGRIKPPDPAKAKAAHEAAREVVRQGQVETAQLPPDEFPSEFADYHRGALAYRSGAAHYDLAHAAWEALLKRPENERHYRSVWAAFMLGKAALSAKDAAAGQWFRQARELAKAGFADPLGLAADSYGWEAKSELQQGHLEAAAKLYLTQLALGDESAIVSLKAVIPDRPRVDGMMSFGPQPPENASDEELKKWNKSQEPQVRRRLAESARSPLLRRLITMHVLATETQDAYWGYPFGSPEEGPKPGERCRRWLEILEKAGLHQLDDADHLGWVAYTAGRYQEAARWLAIARPESPAALWLKAKLERRAGKYAEAAIAMAAAFQKIRADLIPFGTSDFTYGEYRGYEPDQSAAGDLAGLHLTRGEFVQAMDFFLQGKLWRDAAFVGDRVLTVDELKTYVGAHYPRVTAEPKEEEMSTEPGRDWEYDPAENAFRLRWLLARRLVRTHRFDEAMDYFPKEKERAALARYAAAWKDAENDKLTKIERARAFFTAGWIARHQGMEIMGTEEEPDGFVGGGDYPPGYADRERVTGFEVNVKYDDKSMREYAVATKTPLVIPATVAEKKRIVEAEPHPPQRFHYRWVAADLAWHAATLLADGTDELADVLNTGGAWIKDRDEKAADKFVQAIEHRCPHTAIGQAESAKHWFVDLRGPWSEPLDKAEAAAAPDAGRVP